MTLAIAVPTSREYGHGKPAPIPARDLALTHLEEPEEQPTKEIFL